MRPKQIWVHPDFAKIIKINARLDDKNIIEYSKDLSQNMEEFYKKKTKKMNDERKVNEKYKFSF